MSIMDHLESSLLFLMLNLECASNYFSNFFSVLLAILGKYNKRETLFLPENKNRPRITYFGNGGV